MSEDKDKNQSSEQNDEEKGREENDKPEEPTNPDEQPPEDDESFEEEGMGAEDVHDDTIIDYEDEYYYGDEDDLGSADSDEPDADEEGQEEPGDEGAGTGGGDGGDEDHHKKHEDDPEKKMPFLDHLEELRWTILRSLIAVILGAIVCYIFSKQIVGFLRRPGPEDMKLIFLSPTEGFMIYIKVSIFAGLVVALPYVVYEFWKFIVPGLLEKERRLVKPIAFFTVLCFLAGASFAYFVIIPFGLRFLLGFQTDFLEATITIGKYLGFVVTLILVFGVVFELPVLSFFLTKVGIVTPEFLRSKRRYGVVIIFILAAVLTPPDIFTQLMLATPLIILYEISIWVSSMVKRKEKAKEEKEAQEEKENDLAG